MRVKRAGTATLLGLIMLAGCADGGMLSGGANSKASSDSFHGLVIADEPTAATIGRAILEQGGNAADAATATYFALAVTYPVAAGLGGGGVCSVYHQASQTVESVEFLAREAQGGGALAIPGNVRGFALMQARYGALNWAQLISPAENLAQNGFPASRALVRRLAPLSYNANASALIGAIYQSNNAAPLDEGVLVKYPNITQTLSQLRVAGASHFYEGDMAEKIAEAARAQGAALSAQDLGAFRPRVVSLAPVMQDRRAVFLPNAQIGAGAFAQALWSRVSSAAANASVVETSAMSAANAFGVQGLAEDFGSTSFVAVDAQGNAVSCAVSMGKPLGAAVQAADTGILLAPSPANGIEGYAGAFLTPVLVTDGDVERLYFAGAGAGSPKASAGIVYLAARNSLANTEVAALAGGQTASLNVFSCAGGFSQSRKSCSGWADARAYGAALEAAEPVAARR